MSNQGVHRHDTAHALYDLSDVHPSKLHVTVRKAFRRNSAIPKILVLHKANLKPTDSQDLFGVRATTPLRTGSSRRWQNGRGTPKQAMAAGLARGLVTRRQIERADLPPDTRGQLDSWSKRAPVPGGKTYKTPQALRTALEARLLDLAKRSGTDVQRLRLRVAFDR